MGKPNVGPPVPCKFCGGVYSTHTRECQTQVLLTPPMQSAGPTEPHNPWFKVAKEVADLVYVKNRAYGSSFEKCGDVMCLLYPNGVPSEKLGDALVIVRVLDKLFRIATDRDALGESPWRDVLGYALLAVERIERKRAELDSSPAKSNASNAQWDPVYGAPMRNIDGLG